MGWNLQAKLTNSLCSPLARRFNFDCTTCIYIWIVAKAALGCTEQVVLPWLLHINHPLPLGQSDANGCCREEKCFSLSSIKLSAGHSLMHDEECCSDVTKGLKRTFAPSFPLFGQGPFKQLTCVPRRFSCDGLMFHGPIPLDSHLVCLISEW